MNLHKLKETISDHQGVVSLCLAVGLHGMARLFIAVPAGYMAQSYGRRFVLNLGTGLNLLVAVMMPMSFDYYWFTTGVSIYLRNVATPDYRA